MLSLLLLHLDHPSGCALAPCVAWRSPMQNDTTGLGRILLGALTERQWVKEDDLASDLNLHAKMVRRALRYLEQVRFVGVAAHSIATGPLTATAAMPVPAPAATGT